MDFLGSLMKWAILSVGVIVFLAFVALIGAIPTYFLWNWLMPNLFGLPQLTFWQAWGIFWLASVLLKNVGGPK